MPPTLSALIVVHNGEADLPDCLESVRFADEIVVVLDRCTDGSRAIAERYGAKLLEGAWEIEGPRRNAGLAACTGDYTLEIDADERCPPDLATELRAILAGAPRGGVFVPFDNRIGGVPIVHGWGAYNGVGGKRCVFPSHTKTWGPGRLHPPVTQLPEAARTKARMIHHVYRDIPHMFERLLRYCRLAALDMVEADAIPPPMKTARRFFSRFWKSYVARQGRREGFYGVAMALYSALYPALTHLMARELKRKR
ncbi:MAG: glycosyltransferase family 2 protein [Hyphomonadaceae bacterium]|nr:glycosyltransferase family 2 protein [Hyphomonadaceae bacterium]